MVISASRHSHSVRQPCTQTSLKESTRKISHLTRLPPEIRETIYGFILPQDQIIRPNVTALFRDAARHENGKQRYPTHERTLALARTCHQLNNEVASFYYRHNMLNFANVYDLYRYLHMIGPNRRRHLSALQVFLVETNYVSVRCRSHGRGRKVIAYEKVQKWAFELLKDAVSLRRLWLGMRVWGARESVQRVSLRDFKHRDVWDYWEARGDLEIRIVEAWFCGNPWGSDWTARWEG